MNNVQTIQTPPKIFIIGLPRTGTTSICLSLLTLNYKVAHTAYVQKAFEEAQAIADTPIFCDYQQLDKLYPNAKFIYLTRDLDKWVPSIQQLLQRMHTNIARNDGGYNPIIKRCFTEVFADFTLNNINSGDFLRACYLKHQKAVYQYFEHRAADLLTIDISENSSYQKLTSFLAVESPLRKFPHLNTGGKVRAWKDINHSLKIASSRRGRVEKLHY